MPGESGFFDAEMIGEGQYDRVYQAGNFADLFSLFFNTGVFAQPTDQLKVYAKGGLSIGVKPGWAFIAGYWFHLAEEHVFKLTPNSTAYTIDDVIVCELNKSTRQIDLKLKEQASQLLPENSGTKTEIVLATIRLGVGVGTITDSVITDRRPYEEYCGFVTGAVKQISVEELLTQQKQQFIEWFNSIKGQLQGDVATNLQSQVNELKQNMPVIRSGTGEPDNGVGKDGDIYIKIIE